MIKSKLFFLFALLVLAGCQGRGLAPHPSFQKQKERTQKAKHVQENTDEVNETKDNSGEFMTLKLKSKSLAKESSFLEDVPLLKEIGSILTPDIDKIPVVRDVKKLLPEGSKKAKSRVNKKHIVSKPESFSGGMVSDGLDIGVVRLGQSSKYTRLIFDSYKWEGPGQLPKQTVNHSGTYIFTFEPDKRQITAIIDGYRGFSALAGDQSELYEGNPTVETIRLEEYLDDSGFKFVIKLKQDVKVYVYELHNPGRIIVDMIPL